MAESIKAGYEQQLAEKDKTVEKMKAGYEQQLAEKDKTVEKMKAGYEQQLAEKDKTIRNLIMAGESKTGDGPILRAQLGHLYGVIDELREEKIETRRRHEIEMANQRAAHVRELRQALSGNPSGSKTGTKTGSTNSTRRTAGTKSGTKKDQDGEAILTSPTTPSSTDFIGYTKTKNFRAEKMAMCIAVHGKFQPDPLDPRKCKFCHYRHGPTARVGAPFGHKGHGALLHP